MYSVHPACTITVHDHLYIAFLTQTVLATYIDLYTIGCTIEPPIVWYIQKCMLIWKICFYFSFVFAICLSKKKTRHITRDRFIEKKLLRQTIFNSRDPFTYYDWE